MSLQITTVTFFRYNTISAKIWAFLMMQFSHKYLKKINGQSFYRLMGSGKGVGFNPLPDWSVYCLLQVWHKESDAEFFLNSSKLMSRYRNKTSEIWTLYMRNISANGTWVNQKPFEKSETLDQSPHIAIITRATIKLNLLLKFWSHVPASQESLQGNSGLIYSKGVGEVPIIQMATFSLWKDLDSVKQFAYQSKGHQDAIKKTRAYKWYKEELFSRFQPYKSQGTWEGKDPLQK